MIPFHWFSDRLPPELIDHIFSYLQIHHVQHDDLFYFD